MTTFGESCIIGMLLGEFKGILLCIFAVEAYTASWIEISKYNVPFEIPIVEAYTASWIEIQYHIKFTSATPVEAYTASWIEIVWSAYLSAGGLSRLIQPRGLKSG